MTPPPAAIRPAIHADADGLARLHAAHFAPPWSPATFEKLLSAQTTVAYVAEAPDLSGAILASLAADEAEILTFFVAEARQRRGLGRALIDGLLAGLESRGASRLFLEVAVTNVPARELYARAGFLEVGRRRDYYRTPGAPPIDALILARDIAAAKPPSDMTD